MSRILAIFFMILFSTPLYAGDNVEIYHKVFNNNWGVTCYNQDTGTFSHCVFGVQFVDKMNFLIQMNGKGKMAIKFSSDEWKSVKLDPSYRPVAHFTILPEKTEWSFTMDTVYEDGPNGGPSFAGSGPVLEEFLARLATEDSFTLKIGRQDLGEFNLDGATEPMAEMIEKSRSYAEAESASLRKYEGHELGALFVSH